MGLKVIWTAPALTHLEAAVVYIAQDNPAAAEKFGHNLLERVEILSNFPHAGRATKDRRAAGIRYLVEGDYLIFYRVDPQRTHVEITALWHAARGHPDLI